MSDDQPIDPRKAYIKQFRRSLAHWRKTNLSDAVCIDQARRTAKTLHPLTEEQQRDVDEFLKDETKPMSPISPHVGANKSVRVDYETE